MSKTFMIWAIGQIWAPDMETSALERLMENIEVDEKLGPD